MAGMNKEIYAHYCCTIDNVRHHADSFRWRRRHQSMTASTARFPESADSLTGWAGANSHPVWSLKPDALWSDAVRSACNLCGYCGEYLCWALTGAKSGTQVSTIAELRKICAVGQTVFVNEETEEIPFCGWTPCTQPCTPGPRRGRSRPNS